MKNSRSKKIFCFLLCILMICSVFSSCSKNTVIDFIYPFSADVNSYDPQVAATSDEYLIIENTFEGLIRIDDDGTVRKGVAESWSISDDKLTYTFNLKKGIKWDIKTDKYESGDKKGEFKDERLRMLGYEFNPDITAKDFVFALQRAVKPETNCPLFSAVSSIKNAIQINSKKMSANALGVKAVDDYTLVIELSSPDEAFMQTLSSAVAMPCNEEFFNATKGRYGLSTKYTLFNGQFYVNQILESSYLLKKNEQYTGDYPANASELTLKIVDKEDKYDTVDRLLSGYYDAAFISGSESEKIKESSSVSFEPHNDTTWAFVFNTNSDVFMSKTMRKAFCLGFTRQKKPDKKYLSPATNLIPSSCMIGANNAISAIGETVKAQDTKKSIELWKKGLSIIDSDDIIITVLTTESMKSSAQQALQGIQSGIGTVVRNNEGDKISFTLKVKTATEDEIKTAMAKGEYDIALYPYKSTSNSAVAFLSAVEENTPGFSSDSLKGALRNVEKADNLKTRADYLKKAENTIIGTYTIYPVFYETSYYAQAKGVSGVQFHAGTGRVSFIDATREN